MSKVFDQARYGLDEEGCHDPPNIPRLGVVVCNTQLEVNQATSKKMDPRKCKLHVLAAN